MSHGDIKDIDDAGFEAFLRGEGELADLLHAMPQPDASSQLEAAIMADAQAALARPPVTAGVAANDPVIASAPVFLARWKIPLGLAASILLALPLLMQQRGQSPSRENAIVVAAAPASPVPERAEESPQAERRSQRADKDADYSQLAKAEPQLRSPESARPPVVAKRAAPPATDVTNATAPAVKAEAAPAAASIAEANSTQPEPIVIAQGPAPEFAAAPPSVPPAPPAPPMLAAPAPAKPMIASGVGQERSAKAAAPAATPAPAPASVTGAAGAGAVGALKSDAQLADQSAASAPEKAKTWLLQIETLIKAGRHKEALDEWAKFHQAYPDHPVQKPLLRQIEALKKP